MDQGLVVAILVGVIVLLVGLLTLLVVAAVLLALANRRTEADARERARPKERPRKVPTRPTPKPGPAARVADPPSGVAFASPTSADEAATEVMSARHLAALFESEENTGTTEVRGLLDDDGHLQLEDTDETTEAGRNDPTQAAAKKI